MKSEDQAADDKAPKDQHVASGETSARASSNDAARSLPAWVEGLVHATESRFRLPGTSYRFGWDAVLGLIPGVGDLLGAVLGMAIVFAAYQVDASKRVLAKMLGNLALDAGLGALPVVGDIFDFTFKANSRNLDLLKSELERQGAAA